MSGSVQRTPTTRRPSLFYQDLATPISARRGKFSGTGQAVASSALWRESSGGSDLPPPPIYTLEDRLDMSPETGIADYPMSPQVKSEPRSPFQSSGGKISSSAEGKSDGSPSFSLKGWQQNQQGSASFSWGSPSKKGSELEDKGTRSPSEGAVQPGALITLPPLTEVAKPESQINLPSGSLDKEEWVTVYGFSPIDTNLVLREFEKCGVILKHFPGPRGANWMHILYQNHSDAQRALKKNGMQITPELIIGVKPVDPMQHEALDRRLNNRGFMTLHPTNKPLELNTSGSSNSPYYIQNGSSHSIQSGRVIAAPDRSVLSRIMDVMFGV